MGTTTLAPGTLLPSSPMWSCSRSRARIDDLRPRACVCRGWGDVELEPLGPRAGVVGIDALRLERRHVDELFVGGLLEHLLGVQLEVTHAIGRRLAQPRAQHRRLPHLETELAVDERRPRRRAAASASRGRARSRGRAPRDQLRRRRRRRLARRRAGDRRRGGEASAAGRRQRGDRDGVNDRRRRRRRGSRPSAGAFLPSTMRRSSVRPGARPRPREPVARAARRLLVPCRHLLVWTGPKLALARRPGRHRRPGGRPPLGNGAHLDAALGVDLGDRRVEDVDAHRRHPRKGPHPPAETRARRGVRRRRLLEADARARGLFRRRRRRRTRRRPSSQRRAGTIRCARRRRWRRAAAASRRRSGTRGEAAAVGCSP